MCYMLLEVVLASDRKQQYVLHAVVGFFFFKSTNYQYIP